MKGRKLGVGEIPPDMMEEILQGIRCMTWGEAVLVAQDGVLVQVEFSEKRGGAPGGDAPPPPPSDCHAAACRRLAGKIRQEFSALSFGRLTIVVKQGRVTQMERTEKERFTGLDGEGI